MYELKTVIVEVSAAIRASWNEEVQELLNEGYEPFTAMSYNNDSGLDAVLLWFRRINPDYAAAQIAMQRSELEQNPNYIPLVAVAASELSVDAQAVAESIKKGNKKK